MSESTVVWNVETLAGRELDDLPAGTVVVVKKWDGGAFPWVVERVVAKGDNEDLARFKDKADALMFAEVAAKRTAPNAFVPSFRCPNCGCVEVEATSHKPHDKEFEADTQGEHFHMVCSRCGREWVNARGMCECKRKRRS